MQNEFFGKARQEGKRVLLDFGADWCSTCKPVETMLENEIVPEWDDEIVFAKVNVEQRPDLAEKYGILSVPTLVLCSADDEVLWRKSGYIRLEEVEKVLQDQ